MSFEHLIIRIEQRITTVLLNRPDKLNAFAGRMREEIAEAVEEVASNDEVRAIVITGAGRGFCAGADVQFLGELAKSRDTARFQGFLDCGRRVVQAIRHAPKPVIASINGPAAGGGLNMALACDIRLASDKAKFSEAFVKIGLHPDWGGTYFLPRLVGTAKACELMMSGEVLGAYEAERIGLVNRVVPHEQLQAATRELAERLSKMPPLAIKQMKQAIYRGVDADLETMLAIESEAQIACFESNDCVEGVEAFLAKRAPNFKGN